MRRLATLLIAGLAVVAAYSLSPPPILDPDPGVTTTAPVEDVSISRFFHCPWALADDRTNSSYAFMTGAETDFAISYPENGEVDQGAQGGAPRGSAIAIDNTRVRGSSSAIIEFSDGPAAAAVVAIGDGVLAGDICSSTLPAVWHVPGGSTREGDLLTLRLFNPFADDARVNLTAVSELGIEADDSFESVSIPARSTRTFSLNEDLPGRQILSVFVEHVEGSIIPVMVLDNGFDIAMWPGTRHSQAWEFPLAQVDGLVMEIILTNIAPIDVTYTVEIFDEFATVLSTGGGVIDGPGQARVVPPEVQSRAFGVRITADGPFGAVMIGRGETAVVAAVGASTVSDEWLIPGPNSEAAASYELQFLNTGVEPVTITYRKANATGGGDVATVDVAAGAAAAVDVTDIGTSGIVATGTGPFSVAWSARFGGAMMFSGAVPIGE